MNIVKKSKMSDACKSALSHLFNDRELSTSIKDKQISIRRAQDYIRLFIKKYPYARFEVRILDGTNELDNPELTLSIRNFEKLHKLAPYEYLIIVDNSFESVSFYQKSIDGESVLEMELELFENN